jgi:hypothetical protein
MLPLALPTVGLWVTRCCQSKTQHRRSTSTPPSPLAFGPPRVPLAALTSVPFAVTAGRVFRRRKTPASSAFTSARDGVRRLADARLLIPVPRKCRAHRQAVPPEERADWDLRWRLALTSCGARSDRSHSRSEVTSAPCRIGKSRRGSNRAGAGCFFSQLCQPRGHLSLRAEASQRAYLNGYHCTRCAPPQPALLDCQCTGPSMPPH